MTCGEVNIDHNYLYLIFNLPKLNKLMNENELSSIVIGTSIDIHKKIGPGLLENAYKECLFYKLSKMGLYVEKEKCLPLVYEEIRLELGYRIDLLVEKKLVVELKCVESFNDLHTAQLLTYLKMGNYKLGLLLNFNTKYMKEGIKRIIN